MDVIANYINQYSIASNHHQHSDSITRQVHTMITVQVKVVIELMLNYCMMTHLQHYLFMALTLALHPS